VFDDAKGEQPLVISKEYTLSMNEKANLRKDLKSWRGKDFTDEEAKKFDITNLLGVSCMLNVIHVTSKDGSKQYASISGITPLPKGIDCPPQVNKSICLSFDNFDNALFNSMPDFIKEKIVSSVEYKAMQRPQEVEVVEDETINTDDVPF
jgi:hypothetical protein